MADARAAACLAVLTDAADQISETNHRVGFYKNSFFETYGPDWPSPLPPPSR